MTFSAFAFANSFFFERIRGYLEPNVREQLPLGTKSTTDPDSAIHRYCSREKPFVLGRKILPFGIPAVCTDRSSLPTHPLVNKIACQGALQIHSRTHPSFLISSLVLREENPEVMDKGKQPQESSSSKKRTIRK
jgi:hypothetical protein